jgi:hypothetical protein
MIFLLIVIDFTSSQLNVYVYFAVYPLETSFSITNRSLAGLWEGNRGGAAGFRRGASPAAREKLGER